jgi:hypothetical protein
MDDFLEEISEPDSSQMYYTDTLTIAHWNIGHFALGKSSNTTISAEDSEYMATIYRALIDSIDADIFGICEYNPTFSVGGEKTSSFIFGEYSFNCIGSKFSYNCNAIFSRAKLNNNKVVFYDHCVQQRYYVASEITINSHKVFFVETHLDWNQGEDGQTCRANQIQALIKTFRDYPYVIICADYNISDINEYRPFIDSDFSLANCNELEFSSTNMSINPSSVIDNIITKGFKTLSFDVLYDATLSDHSLLLSSFLFMD